LITGWECPDNFGYSRNRGNRHRKKAFSSSVDAMAVNRGKVSSLRLPLHTSRTVGLIASKKGNINIQKAFRINVWTEENNGTVQ
jgi:hypothetical protein